MIKEVILVDKNDEEIGIEEKVKAHQEGSGQHVAGTDHR